MVRSECLRILAEAICAIRVDHPTRVAIDGVDGVGKTTLADELFGCLRKLGREVIRASIDGFHRPRVDRYRRGPDSAEGYFFDSFDSAAVLSELLNPLGPGGDRRYRTAVFDYRVDQAVIAPRRTANFDAVLLMDGVFLQRPEFDNCWDFAIWVETPFNVSVDRATRRDVENGGDAVTIGQRYERKYVPGQRLYLNACQPRDRANVVLENSNLDHPALKIRSNPRRVRG